jgi:hypothetical protein
MRDKDKRDLDMTILDRRRFLTGSAALAAGLAAPASVGAAEAPASASAKGIKAFHESLTAKQKKAMCFARDHKGYGGLPLRLHVSNNWAVSGSVVASFTKEQQELIQAILDSVLAPGWPEKLARQAKDDIGQDWKQDRRVALFGTPGSGECQFVISGFHLTLRATAAGGPVAFGGGIAHGHQPSGFNEKPGHPGNIFWYQAKKAHEVYALLDGKQRSAAVVKRGMPWYEFSGKIDRSVILPKSKLSHPLEPDLRFRTAKDTLPGLAVVEMSRDQKEAVGKVLEALLEPYRKDYREQVLACLKKQGGLEKCRLAFYEEHTIGKKGEWDNWRLEGPSFVWYFRGSPHVHIWIHVANDPDTPVTSHFG